MTRKIAPSEQKVQELLQWFEGQNAPQSGEEWLSAFVRLSTARLLQEAREQEQAEALGRSRYARQPTAQGSRNGYEDGTVNTAEGVGR
jgi:transposase-like protein